MYSRFVRVAAMRCGNSLPLKDVPTPSSARRHHDAKQTAAGCARRRLQVPQRRARPLGCERPSSSTRACAVASALLEIRILRFELFIRRRLGKRRPLASPLSSPLPRRSPRRSPPAPPPPSPLASSPLASRPRRPRDPPTVLVLVKLDGLLHVRRSHVAQAALQPSTLRALPCTAMVVLHTSIFFPRLLRAGFKDPRSCRC